MKFVLCLICLSAPLCAQDWSWLEHNQVIDLHQNFDAFDTPIEIDFDSSGNLFIVDLRANSIFKVSPHGEILFSFGRPGGGPGEFRGVYDISVDRHANRIWVSDQRARKVACYNEGGELLFEKTPQIQPYGIACRSDGYLAVGGTGSNNLILLNPKGEFVKEFGRDMNRPMEGAGLKSHNSRFMYMTYGPDDRLYVAYLNEPVLACYNKSGKLLWEAERPWTYQDGEPIKTVDRGMTFDVQAYQANLCLMDGVVYMSTGKREHAIIAMDAKTGKYLGFRKPPMRARSFALWQDKIYSLNAAEGTLHIHNKKPAFKTIQAHKNYTNRYLVDGATSLAKPAAKGK